MNRTARTWLISFGLLVLAGIAGFTVSSTAPRESSRIPPMESAEKALAHTPNTSEEGKIPEVVIVATRTYPQATAR